MGSEMCIRDSFLDVGIAEEHAVLLAAGLACEGMRPVCAIYSTFLQRAYDPIIHDVCLQNLPVTFCLDRAGLSPNDGPTHHGLFDLSYLSCIPNAVIMQPQHEDELQDMMKTAIELEAPAFIRYPRGEGTGVNRKTKPIVIEVGRAEIIQEGNLCAIWALGDFVSIARLVSEKITQKYGVQLAVVNARFVKPLDGKLLEKQSKQFKNIITLEDNVLKGGFGSSVLEFVEQNNINLRIKRIGWPDKFLSLIHI